VPDVVHQRPALSTWIIDNRKRLGWKVEGLGARLRAAGFEAADTTVRTWEAGRRPSADTIRGLERLFDASAPLADDQTDLVAALDRQTVALTALVERVDLMLAAHSTASVELMRTIGTVASGQAPLGTPAASEPEVRAGTAR